MCNTLQLFCLLNKEEMPSPTDIIVVASAGWSPSSKKNPARNWQKKKKNLLRRRDKDIGGEVVFSVLCHTSYRPKRGLFKNKVW